MKMKTHDFTATFQQGIVSQVDSQRHQVRCIIPALEDLETAWLPFLTPNAGGNQFYCLPNVGELVAILLDAQGESGCVLGTIYNDQDPTPAQDNNIWMKKFSNGTVISHNRSTGDVLVQATGQVTIVSPNLVTIGCPQTKTTGNLLVEGSLIYMQGMTGHGDGGATAVINGSLETKGGDVKADNISLKNHTHLEQGDGKSTSSAR